MGRQSTLEKYGIDIRKDALLKNEYSKEDAYSVEHDNAQSHNDDSHPWGKGDSTFKAEEYNSISVNKEMGYEAKKPTINTETGGGSYDIKGNSMNGGRGREELLLINPYNSDNQYGADSVDTSENVDNYEQYIVK